MPQSHFNGFSYKLPLQWGADARFCWFIAGRTLFMLQVKVVTLHGATLWFSVLQVQLIDIHI
jgi:hypothetical protein